jgi:hypothetical protein
MTAVAGIMAAGVAPWIGSLPDTGLWRRMRDFMKFCSMAAMALLVFAHLGPANWQPRTALECDQSPSEFGARLSRCLPSATQRAFSVRVILSLRHRPSVLSQYGPGPKLASLTTRSTPSQIM